MSLSPRKPSATTTLLGEDDPAHAEIVRRNFAVPNAVHCLEHVVNGEAALHDLPRTGCSGEGATAPRPGLALPDPHLPTLCGLEVLAAIRSEERLECIPVVALATQSVDEGLGRAYRLGVSSHVVKPLESSAFEALPGSL